MNGTAIQALLMQHAHSRDTEAVAEHYDDQLYEVATKLKAQNERVSDLEAKLAQAHARNRNLSDQIATRDRDLLQSRNHGAALSEQLATREDDLIHARHDLAVHKAFIGGLRAIVDAFHATHPDSPLFEKTGRTKKDGNPESKLDRIHYERVDSEIAAAGIENPYPYRPT